MVYLLQLEQHFIAMNFESDKETKVKINMQADELASRFKDNLRSEMEGKLYDVLSILFNNIVGIKKIIVPGDFKSYKGAKAIQCSVKAADGLIYPLKSSLIFIHKPVIYIKHSEIKHVEIARTGGSTFDVVLSKLRDDT